MMSVAGGAVLCSLNEIFVLARSTCGSPALFLPREASHGLLGTGDIPGIGGEPSLRLNRPLGHLNSLWKSDFLKCG